MDNKKDLYKDLENYSRQEAERRQPKANSGIGSITNGPTKKFPVNRTLLFIFLVVSIYYWQGEGLMTYLGDPNSKSVPHIVARVARLLSAHKSTRAVTSSSNSQSSVSTSVGAGQAGTQFATDDDFKTGRYVQIDGRYYRYSDDHIYYINGKKVYFSSVRHAPETPAVSSATGDKLKMNSTNE